MTEVALWQRTLPQSPLWIWLPIGRRAKIVVHCTGKITSDTTQQLRATVKPLLTESKTVVLDLTNVSYMDSSGLGAVVSLYISAKAAKSELKLVNLTERLKEIFSITRVGQVMAQGRDPDDLILP
jgi:anti-sigma B factor antagonist